MQNLPIKPTDALSKPGPAAEKPAAVGTAKGDSFQKVLGDFIDEVNDLQQQAGESIENLAAGKVENLHQVMIAMGKAEVSFKFVMEARNKLVQAYQEIMRMPV